MSHPTPTITTMIRECPRHYGSFDCSPFCNVCEGNQEYESKGVLPCVRFQNCNTYVSEDIWREELGFCQPCQAKYFEQELDPFTLEELGE